MPFAVNLRFVCRMLLLGAGLVCARKHALTPVFAQTSTALPSGSLQITVTDPNGVPLSSAVVMIQHGATTVFSGSTTPSGTLAVSTLSPGVYRVIIEKQGFYSASTSQTTITAAQPTLLEVHLQPLREYREEVDVSAQPSPIDPQQIASTQGIDAEELADIPFFHTRDYRNALPYIPGVISDGFGQIHVAGGNTQQTQDYLDGFEISQPAGGTLALRVNPDALRKIDIESSRTSAQYGKGSAGVLNLQAQDGDNRFRFNATDFIPTLQTVKGITLNTWTPRAYFSGPIIQNRLWFDISHAGENDINIIRQLPDGADRNNVWLAADLARLRLNLSERNVLTATALMNLADSDNTGITALDPVSTATNQDSSVNFFALKDQITLARDTLLEFGAGTHITQTTVRPQGTLPYVFTPTGRTGNFFEFSQGRSERTQGFANLYVRPIQWLGSHQITLGGSVDRVIFHDLVSRSQIQFIDQNSTLLRQIAFTNAPGFSVNTFESGAFLEDRWSSGRLLLEPGVRWDRDAFLDRGFVAPRVAGAYILNSSRETKFSGGIGVYYDRTNLDLISRAFQGSRTDTFLAPAETPVTSSFLVNPAALSLPRFINWSAGLESRLPAKIYGRAEFISRHGNGGWAYEQQPDGSFFLRNNKQDRYDAAQITLRKEVKPGYEILLAYTRSKARSNETLDLSLDNPVFGNQIGGPLGWDAPNQLVSWGWLPLPSLWKLKKLDFAYSVLWHTGFPFITVDQFGRLVSGPAAHRLPDFFSLSPAVEYKFAFHNYLWALRVGIDNITDSGNPFTVDNNINSPTFLQTFSTSHRSLNGRIRLLGKK
ncbi:MAG TPA: carboxypeptidase regulatory-like domain-containing protein [Candidatus Angelobacter sp.]|nr:carboxypeptidase regulatory-like domain-containing protein [Candidatus Angelobacter sp.]